MEELTEATQKLSELEDQEQLAEALCLEIQPKLASLKRRRAEIADKIAELEQRKLEFQDRGDMLTGKLEKIEQVSTLMILWNIY